jgi:hypothetical protein
MRRDLCDVIRAEKSTAAQALVVFQINPDDCV